LAVRKRAGAALDGARLLGASPGERRPAAEADRYLALDDIRQVVQSTLAVDSGSVVTTAGAGEVAGGGAARAAGRDPAGRDDAGGGNLRLGALRWMPPRCGAPAGSQCASGEWLGSARRRGS
jgi:hypothetical protein